jgi:hypothetical protein
MEPPITPRMLILQVGIIKQVLGWDDTSRHEPSFNFEESLHYFFEGIMLANPSLLPGLSIALKEASKLPTVWNSKAISEVADLLQQKAP